MSSRAPNSPATMYLRRNDTLPFYWVDVYDHESNPVDLSAATAVTFSMMGEDRALKVNAQAGAVVVGVDGSTFSRLEYQWQTGDTDESGTYLAQFEVTMSTKKRTFPPSGLQKLKIVITDDLDAV